LLEDSGKNDRSLDRSLYVSFGLVMSLRLGDVEKARAWLESNGAKIIFQTVSSGGLYLLRDYQVRRALQGDVSQLREIYQRKERRVEKTEQ
jgi:hypothetical protein